MLRCGFRCQVSLRANIMLKDFCCCCVTSVKQLKNQSFPKELMVQWRVPTMNVHYTVNGKRDSEEYLPRLWMYILILTYLLIIFIAHLLIMTYLWTYLLIIICQQTGIKAFLPGWGKGRQPFLRFQGTFSSAEQGGWDGNKVKAEGQFGKQHQQEPGYCCHLQLLWWDEEEVTSREKSKDLALEPSRWFLQLWLLLGYHLLINLHKVSILENWTKKATSHKHRNKLSFCSLFPSPPHPHLALCSNSTSTTIRALDYAQKAPFWQWDTDSHAFSCQNKAPVNDSAFVNGIFIS